MAMEILKGFQLMKINEKVNLRDKFDVSNEGKELSSLKNIRGNDRTPITNISEDIVNLDNRIEE